MDTDWRDEGARPQREQGAPGAVDGLAEGRPADAERAEERRLVRSLLSHLPGIAYVCEVDDRWTMRFVSDGCLALTGYAADELLGEGAVSFADLMLPEDRPRVRAAVEAVDAGEPFTVTYQIRHRDGSTRWVWEHGAATGPGGRLEGLILDVSERVLSHERLRESERHHRNLVEHSPDAILLSSGGTIAYANPAAVRLFGRRHDLVGSHLLSLVHPEDRPIALAGGSRTEGDGSDWGPTGLRVVTGAGRVVEVEARSSAITIDGRPATETTVHDVSVRVREERLRRALHGVLEQIATDAPLPAILDAIARIVEDRLPDRLCSIMLVEDGRLRDGAAPSLPAAYRAAIDGTPVGPGSGSCGAAAWSGEPVAADDIATDPSWADHVGLAVEAGLAACWSVPITLRDGSVAATFALYATTPGAAHERDSSVLSQLRHITAVALERAASRAALERSAAYDELTGLPNRRTLREVLRLAIERCGPQRVAALFVDLDDFKDVNDSLGHAAGDAVLRRASRVLQGALDESCTIARFSGDEFVVVCPDIDDPAALQLLIVRLQSLLGQPFRFGGHELRLGASIGVALCGAGDDVEQLLAKADAAMYRAKESGRGNHAWFDDALRDRAARRLELSAALGRALEVGDVEVHYQPLVRLVDGAVIGVEALARWRRPGQGHVSPSEFIPVAEASGLIGALGAHVLHRACADAASWLAERPGAVRKVAVNVSPKQLRDAGLLATVADALAASGLPAGLLCLEVTEGSVMEDVEGTTLVLRALKALGVTIAIDDFGTGYSSLGRLRELPVDTVKIDQGFVAELAHSSADSAIVAAVVAVARALGLGVIAEGVEHEAQRETLLRLGCEEGQGHLWSPPMPAPSLARLLAGAVAPAPR